MFLSITAITQVIPLPANESQVDDNQLMPQLREPEAIDDA